MSSQFYRKLKVVNEPWGNPWEDFSRFWYRKLGSPEGWVKSAFQAAHTTDPAAGLVLNDFGIEIPGTRLWDRAKEQRFFNMVKDMRQEGIPLEAGFQMHLYASDFVDLEKFNQLLENYRGQLRKYLSVNVPVIITEFDLNSEGIRSEDLDLLNAKITEAILEVSFQEGVKDFTFFGLAPDYASNAVAFKHLGQPSLAYYVSAKVILDQLVTDTERSTE